MKILALFLLSLPLAAQCVQQPQISIDGISEWSCRSMTYDDAWGLLAANGIAPVRSARVAELGNKTNRRGRKQLILTGLKIISFGLPFVPTYASIAEDWIIGLLAAAPALVEGGTQLAEGIPEEFTDPPSADGYTSIYTLSTSVQVVSPRVATPAAPVQSVPPAALNFQPSSWVALYGDSKARSVEVIERWRAIDQQWLSFELAERDEALNLIVAVAR